MQEFMYEDNKNIHHVDHWCTQGGGGLGLDLHH